MISRICLIVAALLAFGASPQAQTRARGSCLDRLHRDGADLPAASRQARSTLIANPGRIDAIAARATRVGARERAEMELGIARAAEWLQCIDPYGYKALSDYLRAHPADPVVADLERALNARAAAGGQSTGAATGEGAASADAAAASLGGASAGAAGGADPLALGGPSFAAAGPIVSPSH